MAYWKQRATIRWILQGEDNKKYLKVKATINYRRNYIASLQDDAGTMQDDHQAKAAILWRAFKTRLGTTAETNDFFPSTQYSTNRCRSNSIGRSFHKTGNRWSDQRNAFR